MGSKVKSASSPSALLSLQRWRPKFLAIQIRDGLAVVLFSFLGAPQSCVFRGKICAMVKLTRAEGDGFESGPAHRYLHHKPKTTRKQEQLEHQVRAERMIGNNSWGCRWMVEMAFSCHLAAGSLIFAILSDLPSFPLIVIFGTSRAGFPAPLSLSLSLSLSQSVVRIPFSRTNFPLFR